MMHKGKNGRDHWLQVNIYPLRNKDRRPRGACLIMRDITRQKKSEKALRYSASLFNFMKAAVVSTDPQFRIIDANRSAEQLAMQRVADLKGQRASTALDYTYLGSTRKAVMEKLLGQDCWEGRILFRRKDGRQFYMNSSITAVRDENGQLDGYLGVHRDMSDQIALENEAKQQQAYINAVFEAAPESLFLLSRNNKIIVFNSRAQKLLKTIANLRVQPGIDLFELLPAFRRKEAREKIYLAWTGRSVEYEVCYPNGRWLWVSCVPVRGKNREIGEICVGLRDITPHKKLESDLRKSEEQHRSLVESLAEGVIFQSLDGRTVTCNAAAQKILRLNPGDIQKLKFPLAGRKIVDEKKRPLSFQRIIKDRLHDRKLPRDLVIGIARQKKIQWLSLNVEPVRGNGDEVIGWVYTFNDITRRKKMYRELKILILAANKINNSVVVTDAERRVVWVNKAFTHNTGYSVDEVKGKVPGRVLQGPITDRGTVNFMRKSLKREQPFECEVQNYRKNGETFWMRIQVQPLYNDDGSVGGYLGVGANITEQKKLQEKLILQEIQAQRAITRATIAGQEKERNELGRELHDNINQVLAATKLQLEFHLKTPGGMQQCVETGYQYLGTAIQEIRSLSRNLVSPRLLEHSLEEEIGFVAENLDLAHCTKVKIDPDSVKCTTEEMKMSLFRIIQEQLNNIRKYANASKVEITLGIDGRQVKLTIKDNGRGFDPKQKRAGIGLYNIRTRAEVFNGSISIDSSPGNGCRLDVLIPRPAPAT
jgi:PAS domain S-box-containing protein